jgi:LacI family transcriptional regulator
MKKLPRVALLIETSRAYGRAILNGIANYAHAHGPWSFFTVERVLHSRVPQWVETWRGDGIIARIEDRRMAAQLLRCGCPVVDVLGQAHLADIHSFDTDAAAVAEMAANLFLRAGFRHFAFCGYTGIPFSDQRRRAFVAYLQTRGHSVQCAPSLSPTGRASDIQGVERRGITGLKTIAAWLQRQQRPLAVLACNDTCAQQVLNACREHGLRVPEQIAVVGVDNDDVLCNLCDPPLSSVEPDAQTLGARAAALLDRLMQGEAVPPQRVQIAPRRLVERASTDTVPIPDPLTAAAVRYIRNHVSEGISVKDVLVHVGRSRTVLEERFRQQLHRTVHEEIANRRTDEACRLLRETKLSLQEVADRTGFGTAAHLCRWFRRHFGRTPSQYRLPEK